MPCPIHFFWNLIKGRVRPTKQISPSFTATKVNAAIEAVFKKLEIPNAFPVSPNGFRLGEANELKEQGRNGPPLRPLGAGVP